MRKTPRAALLALLSTPALLAGCGGGGSAADPLPASQTTVPSAQNFSGRVIDGYIEGATACLDLNRNGQCDAGEPQGKTDAAGRYAFETRADKDTLARAPLLAQVPAGAIDHGSGERFARAFTLKAPAAANNAAITPFSTLQLQLAEQKGLAHAEAGKLLADKLGLSDAEVLGDYVARAHHKAQNQAMLLTALLAENGHAQTLAQLEQPAVNEALRQLPHDRKLAAEEIRQQHEQLKPKPTSPDQPIEPPKPAEPPKPVEPPQPYTLLQADGSATTQRAEAACVRLNGDAENTVWLLTDYTLRNRARAAIKGNMALKFTQPYASDVDGEAKLISAKALIDLANLQRLCGYSDWQLPSGKQLAALLQDNGQPRHAQAFSDHDAQAYYWVRYKEKLDDMALRAPFDGKDKLLPRNPLDQPQAQARLVRYVRIGAYAGLDLNGASTVKQPACFTQRASGKTWALASSGTVGWVKSFGQNGASELLATANAGRCGLKTGWRLPTPEELAGLRFNEQEPEDQALSGLAQSDNYWLAKDKLSTLSGKLTPASGFSSGKALFIHD